MICQEEQEELDLSALQKNCSAEMPHPPRQCACLKDLSLKNYKLISGASFHFSQKIGVKFLYQYDLDTEGTVYI